MNRQPKKKKNFHRLQVVDYQEVGDSRGSQTLIHSVRSGRHIHLYHGIVKLFKVVPLSGNAPESYANLAIKNVISISAVFQLQGLKDRNLFRWGEYRRILPEGKRFIKNNT